MKKRITLVACYDDKSYNLINKALSLLDNKELCKVPLNIENREQNDTLPYHITLSAWSGENIDYILNKINNLNFKNIKTKFVFDIRQNSDMSYMLYLKPKDDSKLKELQSMAYEILPTERYNPSKYILHSTININEDKNIIENQLNKLKDLEIELLIDKVCLFEIYPAHLIISKDLR